MKAYLINGTEIVVGIRANKEPYPHVAIGDAKVPVEPDVVEWADEHSGIIYDAGVCYETEGPTLCTASSRSDSVLVQWRVKDKSVWMSTVGALAASRSMLDYGDEMANALFVLRPGQEVFAETEQASLTLRYTNGRLEVDKESRTEAIM